MQFPTTTNHFEKVCLLYYTHTHTHNLKHDLLTHSYYRNGFIIINHEKPDYLKHHKYGDTKMRSMKQSLRKQSMPIQLSLFNGAFMRGVSACVSVGHLVWFVGGDDSDLSLMMKNTFNISNVREFFFRRRRLFWVPSIYIIGVNCLENQI